MSDFRVCALSPCGRWLTGFPADLGGGVLRGSIEIYCMGLKTIWSKWLQFKDRKAHPLSTAPLC